MTNLPKRLRAVEPYWYPIVLFIIAATILYLYHLQTGFTPGRSAITIEALNLSIFWYGILIVGGVALGAYVVSRLAMARAQKRFEGSMPAALRRQPLGTLDLPKGLETRLRKRDLETVGDLVFQWGLNPARLEVDEAGLAKARQRLEALPGFDARWLRDAPWRQWDPDHVWNGVAWCLVLGLIGARLYHVLTPSPSMAEVGIFSPLDYFEQPLELINVRRGGLGIYGGIAGGLLGLILFARRNRLDALAWADLAAVGLPLGQAIGRWGNFMNQELYGRPTDLPWAVNIDPAHRLAGYENVARFHPAFLYESIWNFLTFLALLWLARHREGWLRRGDLTALYLIFYGVGRILMEMVRLDSAMVSLAGLEVNISIAALVSLLIAGAMAVWVFQRHYRPAQRA